MLRSRTGQMVGLVLVLSCRRLSPAAPAQEPTHRAGCRGRRGCRGRGLGGGRGRPQGPTAFRARQLAYILDALETRAQTLAVSLDSDLLFRRGVLRGSAHSPPFTVVAPFRCTRTSICSIFSDCGTETPALFIAFRDHCLYLAEPTEGKDRLQRVPRSP